MFGRLLLLLALSFFFNACAERGIAAQPSTHETVMIEKQEQHQPSLTKPNIPLREKTGKENEILESNENKIAGILVLIIAISLLL